jgi:23S rRNA pseudouridine2605 synthase
MRISKALSNYGACSRRDAEKLIAQGQVKVNDVVITTPICFVQDSDAISVSGVVISKPTSVRLWKYFKPKGVITSNKDELGRTTLFEILPKNIGRVISVGRLDYNTEGLILLTNNGDLARTLELPSTNIKRMYLCKAHGRISTNMIEELSKGMTVNDVNYAPIIVRLRKQQGANVWYEVTLSEGKNREIRNVFEHFNQQVSRLIRISYGKFTADDMQAGDLSEINYQEFCEYINNVTA